MSTSASATTTEPQPVPKPLAAAETAAPDVVRFPTETEIYLLPDGRVVVADLPAELAAVLAQLGAVEPCAITPDVGAPAQI